MAQELGSKGAAVPHSLAPRDRRGVAPRPGGFPDASRDQAAGPLQEKIRMDEAQKIEIAVRYACDWYTYHASQRMMAVRFYLAIIGVLLVVHGTEHDHGVGHGECTLCGTCFDCLLGARR